MFNFRIVKLYQQKAASLTMLNFGRQTLITKMRIHLVLPNVPISLDGFKSLSPLCTALCCKALHSYKIY